MLLKGSLLLASYAVRNSVGFWKALRRMQYLLEPVVGFSLVFCWEIILLTATVFGTWSYGSSVCVFNLGNLVNALFCFCLPGC